VVVEFWTNMADFEQRFRNQIENYLRKTSTLKFETYNFASCWSNDVDMTAAALDSAAIFRFGCTKKIYEGRQATGTQFGTLTQSSARMI
jgi:hypothetical protein